MLPGGKAYGAKVALRLAPRAGDAEAVRADQTGAMRADEREQVILPRCALVPELGEARGDDAQRRHAQGERPLRRVQNELRRQADDCEIDSLGHLLDRRVPGDAGHLPRRSGSPDTRGRCSRRRRHCGRARRRSIPVGATRPAPPGSWARRRAAGRRRPPRGRARRPERGRPRRQRSRTRAPPLPRSNVRATSKPASANTLSMATFSGRTRATNRSTPCAAARAASCSSRRVPMPRPWRSSATAKATSAFAGSRSRS